MENAIDNQKITFKIAGNELQKEEGYNLRFILESLSSFETLLDKTYYILKIKVECLKMIKKI